MAKGDKWSLPLFIDWQAEEGASVHHALISPACAFYPSQFLVVQAMLGHHDLMGSKERWFVTRQIAETFLVKAKGITPRYYYQWDDPEFTPIDNGYSTRVNVNGDSKAPADALDGETESFLAHLSQRRSIPTSMLRVVWQAITDEGPRWLLDHRGSIEFGFCKLVAVPFRANWKQIVAFRCKNWNLRSVFRMHGSQALEALRELGLPGVLCSTKNIGIRSGKGKHGYQCIDYTLEAIPHKKFTDAALVCEGKRTSGGSASYVRHFETTVEKHYHALVEALRYYCKAAARPFVRLHESGNAGLLGFVPTTGNHLKVRGVGLRHLPVSVVEDDTQFSVLSEPDTESPVHPKAVEMSSLHGVPQAPDDVRGRHESKAVDERQRRAGRFWLLLPNVGPWEIQREPVLPEPETRHLHNGEPAPRLESNGDRR